MTRRVIVDGRMAESSGIGTYFRNIVSRWTGDGQNLAFISRSGVPPAVLPDGAAIYESEASIYSIKEQIDLWKFRKRGEIFWAPHWNAPIIKPKRMVVTIHDVIHLARPEFFSGLHKQAYAKGMMALIRRHADRVICISEFTKSELIRISGIEEERITVVHNGVDPSWFHMPDGDRCFPHKYILFVGNLKPHKNLSRLVQSFARIWKDTDCYLVIVGQNQGMLTVDADAISAAEALGNRIVMTGKVDDQSLRRYFRDAAAVVIPSLYEGFGLPPLEAMALGKPVLVSDIPALREVCGEHVQYCDPYSVEDIAEKIRAILESPPRPSDLLRAQERARHFDWDQCSALTWNIINS